MATFKVAKGLVQFPLEGPGFTRATSSAYMTYAHPGLVDVLQKACAATAERFADSLGLGAPCVVIKDLNTADGKPAKGHKTHGAGGKNVDVGYFYEIDGTREVKNEFFNHKSLDYKVVDGLRYLKAKTPGWSLAANWIFCCELLRDHRVTQILVDPLYCVELEAEARRSFPDAKELKRVLSVIQFLGNHDNHYHLTIVP